MDIMPAKEVFLALGPPHAWVWVSKLRYFPLRYIFPSPASCNSKYMRVAKAVLIKVLVSQVSYRFYCMFFPLHVLPVFLTPLHLRAPAATIGTRQRHCT
jgi:hypothetical protein